MDRRQKTRVVSGIPTWWAGTLFRSLLEAKWASFCDEMGWRWSYESIELNGYIPDFIVTLPHAPVLVEVKPEHYTSDLRTHRAKIDRTEWADEVLIVGSSPVLMDTRCDVAPLLGLLREADGPGFRWDNSVVHQCQACQSVSFHSEGGSWHCRACGASDGNKHVAHASASWVLDVWRRAAVRVRYEHTPNPTPPWEAA